ncbi:MAG: hypothetical protein COB36_10920 [Alphaproteobacteria bacterium]|nr:MAG: hypothetical protein COB36_10920 [Alphaproteobacteria bacterium]
MKRSFADTLRLLILNREEMLKASGAINGSAAARLIKINQSTLSRMLNDRSGKPSSDNADKLKKCFGVTYDQLTGKEPVPGIDETPNFTPTQKIINRVPLISFVAAGDMCETVDPYPLGAAEDWVDAPVNITSGMYALRVDGDSMTSLGGTHTFPHGFIIVVDPEKEARSGSFVIVRDGLDSKAVFKKLYLDGDDAYLVPLNPKYETKKIKNELHVCGVVVSVHQEVPG